MQGWERGDELQWVDIFLPTNVCECMNIILRQCCCCCRIKVMSLSSFSDSDESYGCKIGLLVRRSCRWVNDIPCTRHNLKAAQRTTDQADGNTYTWVFPSTLNHNSIYNPKVIQFTTGLGVYKSRAKGQAAVFTSYPKYNAAYNNT